MIPEPLLVELADALDDNRMSLEDRQALARRLRRTMYLAAVRGDGRIDFANADVIAIHQAAQGNYAEGSPAWMALMSIAARITESLHLKSPV